MAEIINLHVAVSGDRYAALDLRDEITQALKPLGIRISATVNGLDVYLTDEGTPTIAELMNERARLLEERDGYPSHE